MSLGSKLSQAIYVNRTKGNLGLPQVTLPPPPGSRRRSGDTDNWIEPKKCASARKFIFVARTHNLTNLLCKHV
jgi:hypothetical protein